MDGRIREEFRGLFARLGDLALRARQGEVATTAFLSPRELHYGLRYLAESGARARSFGGYSDAERQRIYLLPDYMDPEEEEPLEALLRSFGYDTDIAALRIRGSGYRTLGHRDFLGALLGLGLERSVLGDLCVNGEGSEATLFCDGAIADFILTEMTKAANDKVRLSRLRPEELSLPPRRYQSLTDTVASPRLDSVVAALCNLSRERARQTVESDLVEMNYEREDRPDRTVPSGALISVRGFGKFRILSLEDRTKKGRFRLVAEKFL